MHDATAALCLVCGCRFPLSSTDPDPASRPSCPTCGATTIELPWGKGVYADTPEPHEALAQWANDERDELS